MTSRLRDAGALKDLGTLYRTGTVGNLTDGQLLDWFVTGRAAGEAAEAGFTVLVDRHGPMVLRVCRQILGDTHDAHDAFQATFLILVRKAGSVRKRDSVASWLHGIARRVAQRARADRVRRREYERRSAEMTARTKSKSTGEQSWPEVHEEVARLPEKYRESVVLCYLEGLTTEEAARRLGCPQGTILSRLARARERLRVRLTRRGLPLPAGLITTGTFADAARTAAVPSALSHSVVQSALKLAAGAGATSVVPATVASLTEGVLSTMLVTKLGITAAAVTAVAALAAGAGAIVLQAPAGRSQAAGTREESRLSPSALVANIGKSRAMLAPGLVPEDLKWTVVPPDERLRILESIAARLRANFERIRTWKGVYTFREDNLILATHVPPGAAGARAIQGLDKLVQVIEGRMGFAIDMTSGNIYRDYRYGAMTYRKPGTRDAIDIPGAGLIDTRSVFTKDQYLIFEPDQQATYGSLAYIPEARNKRRARRIDPRRVKNAHREYEYMIDPRRFYALGTFDRSVAGIENIVGNLKGQNGDKARRKAEEQTSLAQANGPDGRWYCHSQRGWDTTFWSPRAGDNPVGYLIWFDMPAGKISMKVEWEWTVIDGIYVPSGIKELGYEVPGDPPSYERESTLSDCVLNKPLDPHQFDHAGLGMADGDLIIDEAKREGYIIKAGEAVKLGDFAVDNGHLGR